MRLDTPVRFRNGVSMSGMSTGVPQFYTPEQQAFLESGGPSVVPEVVPVYIPPAPAYAPSERTPSGPSISQLDRACAAGQLPLDQCMGGQWIPTAGYALPTGPSYIPPPPQPAPVFIMTIPAGMATPVSIPTLTSYLNDAAYSAFNISNPAAGGNLPSALDSINQAAATYHSIYPDAPYAISDVQKATTMARSYYAGQPVFSRTSAPVTSIPAARIVSGGGSGTQGGGSMVLRAQPAPYSSAAPTGPNPFLPQNPTPTTAPSASAVAGAGPDLVAERVGPDGKKQVFATYIQAVNAGIAGCSQEGCWIESDGRGGYAVVEGGGGGGGGGFKIDFSSPLTWLVGGGILLGVVAMMGAGKER